MYGLAPQERGSSRWCWLMCGKVFLNIVLDEAVEEKAGGEKVRLGMVVIRGNSVVMLEVSGLSICQRRKERMVLTLVVL